MYTNQFLGCEMEFLVAYDKFLRKHSENLQDKSDFEKYSLYCASHCFTCRKELEAGYDWNCQACSEGYERKVSRETRRILMLFR